MQTIFTTHGDLPIDQVHLVETVTHDDEMLTITRVDKYLVSTGEWVGNDLHGRLKKGVDIGAATASLS